MKILLFITSLILVFSVPSLASYRAASGYVYVYEVVTEQRSFQTVSKMAPSTFYMYNGGEDTIYALRILKVYPRKDFNKALSDYEITEGHVRTIEHTPVERDIRRRPYYWWR
jgi:hypothetical protein